MRIILLSTLIVANCIAAAALPARAQTILDRAHRDELFLAPNEDPGMAAAMRKARTTLKDFLALASRPQPTMKGFAVKVAVREGKEAEYFWIAPFEPKGARFTGRINNTPRTVRHVKAGQTIEFSEQEIADWLYLDNGKMKGNYTACVLIRNEPKDQQEAFKKRFGLDCDA
jgi:uncharacterized protein YegJ (DUF2314 family)